MLLFSLVAQPLVLYVQKTFRPLLNLWMADDGNVVAPIDVAQKIYEYIKSEGPPVSPYERNLDQGLVAYNFVRSTRKI